MINIMSTSNFTFVTKKTGAGPFPCLSFPYISPVGYVDPASLRSVSPVDLSVLPILSVRARIQCRECGTVQLLKRHAVLHTKRDPRCST